MDKEVSLTIKVNTNGEDKIHNVKASASELAQTIKDVEDAHESLNKQVLNINQLQQAWSNLYEGCRQVADIVTGLTSAYNVQVQPREQLTTEEIKRRYREAMEKRGMAGSVEIPKEDEQGDDAHHR
ncbi:MAG: hypothetical protein SPI57_08985 [Prevotella sp.]|nr:hypothetical protein [Prevotella sp.]